MDNSIAGEMRDSLERIANALDRVAVLLDRKNDLLSESLQGQQTSNDLHRRQIALIEAQPLVYEPPQPFQGRESHGGSAAKKAAKKGVATR